MCVGCSRCVRASGGKVMGLCSTARICVTLLWEGVGMQPCMPHQRLICATCCGVFAMSASERTVSGWRVLLCQRFGALVSVSCPWLGPMLQCLCHQPVVWEAAYPATLHCSYRPCGWLASLLHGLYCAALLAAHTVRGGALVRLAHHRALQHGSGDHQEVCCPVVTSPLEDSTV